MKNQAYKIEVEAIPQIDMDYNANVMMHFDNYDLMAGWMMGTSSDIRKFTFEPPQQLYVLADFHWKVQERDYVDNNFQMPLFSNRFLELVHELGKVEYDQIPVSLIDDTYFDPLFDENNNLRTEVPHNSNYSAIRLADYIDVFDYDRSEYDKSELFEGELDYIDQLILKAPADGFPPIFRIKEDLTLLLVNGALKAAIEKAGLSGFTFEAVEVC